MGMDFFIEVDSNADHLIPNSECRWCGTGSVTVDSEWHMRARLSRSVVCGERDLP